MKDKQAQIQDLLDQMFGDSYLPKPSETLVFGDAHVGTMEKFLYGEYRTVARIEKSGTDGQTVEIDECRVPARFFQLRALPEGDKKAFTLRSGSGEEMAKLFMQLGREIARGMIGAE